MKNECREYAFGIAQDIKAAYNGTSADYESIWDYISENSLDVEYTLDSNKELIGVTIYVTLGGPTCWIDTRRKEVVCHWGTEQDSVYIDSDIADEITEMFADIF